MSLHSIEFQEKLTDLDANQEISHAAFSTVAVVPVRILQEPMDRPGLLQTSALHGQIQVTVVLDRIAIGIQQRRIPVAQGLVPSRAVEGQANVPAGDVEL